MIKAICVATVGVSDLDSARDYYQDCFDYDVLGEGPVSTEEIVDLWGGTADQTGRQVLLGPAGADVGLVRLIQVSGERGLYWGDYSRMHDYGHYALNFRSPDIERSMAKIRSRGGRAKSGPKYWTVGPDLSAWDSLSFDPDDILLDVFQLETGPTSPLHDYDGGPEAFQTIAIHSSDARRAAAFYAALGMRPMYNKLLEGMWEFFGLPEGVALHNINMMNPQTPNVGRLEIAQYVGLPGRSQRDTAVAGALGIISAAFETDDFDATEALLEAIGGEHAGEVFEGEQPGIGRIRSRCWFGPDDERLEFFQRV